MKSRYLILYFVESERKLENISTSSITELLDSNSCPMEFYSDYLDRIISRFNYLCMFNTDYKGYSVLKKIQLWDTLNSTKIAEFYTPYEFVFLARKERTSK